MQAQLAFSVDVLSFELHKPFRSGHLSLINYHTLCRERPRERERERERERPSERKRERDTPSHRDDGR